MRKVKVLALVIVALMFCPVITFAQGSEEKKEPMVEQGMKEKQIEKERMAGTMMMKMMGMMQKQMVATNDGGVIVLVGNKLLKYDKDLNLVKEAELKTPVELKMDVEPMQKMMEKMKEKYEMRGKMIKGESQDK